MPNFNEAFPSNYVKASDLKGNEAIVTIDRIAFEPVGRTKEMKAVAYFTGKEKGLVLNKTNATKIATLAGSQMTEDWPGTRIKIYPTETEFGGETVECIRVKGAPATNGNGNGAARQQARQPVRQPEPEPEPQYETHSAPLTDDDIPF